MEGSQEQRENRLVALRDNAKRKHAEESQEQRENYRLAFRYSQVDDYSLSRCVQNGTMSKICPYCKALNWNAKSLHDEWREMLVSDLPKSTKIFGLLEKDFRYQYSQWKSKVCKRHGRD